MKESRDSIEQNTENVHESIFYRRMQPKLIEQCRHCLQQHTVASAPTGSCLFLKSRVIKYTGLLILTF